MYKGAPDGNQTILRERLGRLTSPDLLALRGDRQVNLAFDRADDRFIWITDHGERVGLVDQDEAILEWVAPHPGIEPPGPRSYPPSAQTAGRIASWCFRPPSARSSRVA